MFPPSWNTEAVVKNFFLDWKRFFMARFQEIQFWIALVISCSHMILPSGRLKVKDLGSNLKNLPLRTHIA